MKAIQIKYLPPTDHKGGRLKAFTEAGSLTKPRNPALNLDKQAMALAEAYIFKKGWNARLSGFGVLPNGDYVATLENEVGQ